MPPPEARGTSNAREKRGQLISVCLCDGEFVTRVSQGTARELLERGAAEPMANGRYLRLLPGLPISQNPTGWEIIDTARELKGDAFVAHWFARHDRSLPDTASVMQQPKRSANSRKPKCRVIMADGVLLDQGSVN